MSMTITPTGTNKFEISWTSPSTASQPSAQASSSTTTTTSSPSSSAASGAAPTAVSSGVDKNKVWTWAEVAKHNKADDCWVVVNGDVLDVTDFLDDHPGGKNAILLYAGKDATAEFNMLHKKDVVEKYSPESIIGKIEAKAKL